MTADPRGYPIPPGVMSALTLYRDSGVRPGSCTSAILEGDLFESVNRADLETMRALPAIVCWVYNNMPHVSWGSKRKFKEWMEHRGLSGLSDGREVNA